ncbi:ABC transporter ATP-binding protein [Alicyclobacillus macrosporangiidus]|uniref:Oligopeptide/dipeptide ABC transporter, ATP-binding protein, C-terminal domain-containing protein n=1 Tax=Alicyclobacillus macrosporangiidus TaxID=392015 RepID=A0A1I7J1X2_9BACL|nr:ABC transporter ATP-binding protein [Alicyclobacillus macrosporangiidus]SFU79124.1 oligopeptide/dipeptide ABC transporter, ATP-binding protein, C-terminal domain-containing protein [Alicyclobacillus macrosporangiidus]
MEPLLRVQGLRTHFFTDEGVVRSVDGVDLEVRDGETLGIVGESGCGKSVTSLSIMRLVPSPPGRIVAGEIRFQGRDLLKLSDAEMRKIRGNEIAMIFQEPMTSLNPVFRIGDQIGEVLRLHLRLSKKQARARAAELLREVGIPRPEQIVHDYPHQLSGGMRQRVMIAMAMACRPKLLIADEPTTALDVTIQAQILDLMRAIKQEAGTSIVMITHDLGVVAEMCDRVVVMYAGKVVEEADVHTLFKRPQHPYTQGLLASMPRLNERRKRLVAIPGNVPTPFEMPKGCKFAPRCPHATAVCHESEPELLPIADDRPHTVRCWLHSEHQEALAGAVDGRMGG